MQYRYWYFISWVLFSFTGRLWVWSVASWWRNQPKTYIILPREGSNQRCRLHNPSSWRNQPKTYIIIFNLTRHRHIHLMPAISISFTDLYWCWYQTLCVFICSLFVEMPSISSLWDQDASLNSQCII